MSIPIKAILHRATARSHMRHHKTSFREIIDGHVVAVEPRRFNLLEWVSAWSLLGPTVDGAILDALHPMDVVVREAQTGRTVYRFGPLFGTEANQAAEQAYSAIRLFGLSRFLAEAAR